MARFTYIYKRQGDFAISRGFYYHETFAKIESLRKFPNLQYRGSYMNVHVLLNVFNEFGKRDKMRGWSSILKTCSQRI